MCKLVDARRFVAALLTPLALAGCNASTDSDANAAGSSGNAAATSGADTVAVRITRAGLGDVPGLRKFIDLSYGACLASLGRQPAPAPALPQTTLAGLVTHEEEELFDGKRWAKYETDRAIGADAANGCRLVVFQARSVQAEVTCESSLRGTAATLSELLDPQAAPPAPELQQDSGANPECDGARPQLDLAGLTAVDAGQGQQCIWNAALVARAAGRGGAVDAGGSDVCLNSRRPFYWVKGFGRPVVLQTRSDDLSQTGAYLPSIAGQTAGFGNMKLVSYTEGGSISSDRFSRSAAEAFLRQPIKTPLAETR